MRKPIAAAASVSFSMYLIHYPLFLFFGALFPRQTLTIGLSTLSVIIVFGIVFERNRALLRGAFATFWPTKAHLPAYK